MNQGFPGGAVVESPHADAGDTGSCPGLGRSHMPRSGWAGEPWPLSLRVRSLCSATGEATTVRGPRTAKTNKQTYMMRMLNLTEKHSRYQSQMDNSYFSYILNITVTNTVSQYNL